MEPPPTRLQADAAREKVPDELVNQLHDANERFHSAKEQLEEVMDDSEYDHQTRVQAGTDKLRDAEREVEEVTEKIHKEKGWPSAGGNSQHVSARNAGEQK
ncbi:MAG: hypothetical protein JWL69_4271 [Phycisphaerales bacterium]|jgi:predicted  nucleic acid-binding Zn-ribbon protein|nr:hypothetical protein [Phycisphaerales bacterium]MDB5358005.1 hypothetical protein [Phycisphaerales bacterium]